MNSMEKSMLLDELFALRKADKEERDRLLEKLDRMTDVRWWGSAKTRCSLLAAAWQMYRQPIIRCFQHAE